MSAEGIPAGSARAGGVVAVGSGLEGAIASFEVSTGLFSLVETLAWDDAAFESEVVEAI